MLMFALICINSVNDFFITEKFFYIYDVLRNLKLKFMKKLTLVFSLFVLSGLSMLLAQAVVINGTVTSSVEGEGPVPGVQVIVKGTTIGTTTDVDGKYELTVPEGSRTLMYIFVGMKTIEEDIEGRTTINIVMEPDVLGIDEVIVTSLGITRDKKALGYAVQDVSGEEIMKARESNIVNSLQGKVAGVQITMGDGSVSSGSRIILRGLSSLTVGSNNQPLFVVDGVPISNSYTNVGGYGGLDYGNAAMDINPGDIETLSVLKGANAAALYGSRAINGVVLITTKSGKSRAGKGLGISLEVTNMWDNVLVNPDYQDKYGQGSDGEFWYYDGAGGGLYDNVDESWGPPLDYVVQAEDLQPGGKLYWTVEQGLPQTAGQILSLPQFDSPYDPETDIRQATPFISHPNNISDDFFTTGHKRTVNLALSGATENSNFRLSLANQDISGTIPFTDLRKNTVQLNAGMDVTDRLNVSGGATYISNVSDNIVEGGYNQGNPMQSIGQWFGRQVDVAALDERWEEIDPITKYPFNWNHSYHDNPFWLLRKNTNSRNRDRIIANVNLNLDITDWLAFRALVGNDWYVEDRAQRTAHGTNGDRLGAYGAQSYRRNELNANAMFSFNKDFGEDFNVTGTLGGEYNHYDYQYHATGIQDLIVPDLYSVSNAAVQATTGLSETHTELQSVFGTVNLGFRNYLFLDLTGRNDWSSTLPIDNNSYFYPSVSLGAVITEALDLQSNILSYAKIRGSYAEVGGTAGAYQLLGTYGSSNPFNGQPRLGYTSTIPPLGLKPQNKVSIEFGGEFKFLNNRLGVDFTWYKENTINQILSLEISRTTGFSSKRINAGNLQNKGLEIQLYATPVETPNFSWDLNLNWATNENKVVELLIDEETGEETLNYLNLYNASWSAQVHARPGEEYGVFWGYAMVKENATPIYYDDAETQLSHWEYSGRYIIDPDNGLYIRSNSRTDLGNVYPDWFGGLTNSFRFKDLTASFTVDFRKGGVIYSVTDWFGAYAGVLEKTAVTNANGVNIREPVADGGGILLEGVYGEVNSDGTIQLTDAAGNPVNEAVTNSTYVDAQTYFKDYWGKHEISLFDGSYVKLREVSIGYDFRNIDFLANLGVRGAKLSLVGRNLFIFYKDTPDIDPETGMGAGNYVGMETNAIPTVRSMGFDLKLNF